jgi:hypothetical protein
MPKYIPMVEEIEKSHSCFICGCEVWGESETCDNEICKQQMKIFVEDFYADQLSWADSLWNRSDRD